MKIVLSFILSFLMLYCDAQVYDANNITMLGHWDGGSLTSVGTGIGNRYSGCYGYEQGGKEYAIVGNADYTYFINIDDPTNLITIDSVAGALQNCVWREYRVFQNFVYAVSDDAGANRLQIIDLQYLPDSVHVVVNSDSIAKQIHTIFIEDTLLYGGSVTYNDGTFSAMTVWSIADPTHPIQLRKLTENIPTFAGHVHDMFANNDTVYLSCGFDGLQVVVFNRDTRDFILVGSLTGYPFSGYNHSVTIMDDGLTMIMADEVPADLPFKSVDISDLSDMQVLQTVHSKYGATPHNPYNAHYNNRCYVSCYQDGLMVYDVSRPDSLVLTGFFDTHFATLDTAHETDLAYKGSWGAYMFTNKMIITNDMQTGLYVLDATEALNNPTAIRSNPTLQSLYVYPTICENEITIACSTNIDATLQYDIKSLEGKIICATTPFILNGNSQKGSVATANLSTGFYLITIRNSTSSRAFKFFKK